MIRSPHITLYATDLARSRAFYEGLGFNLGIAQIDIAAGPHGFEPNLGGHTIELVFWNDDTDALFACLVAKGAPILAEPHD
jgi:hypothetical protein